MIAGWMRGGASGAVRSRAGAPERGILKQFQANLIVEDRRTYVLPLGYVLEAWREWNFPSMERREYKTPAAPPTFARKVFQASDC